MTEPSEDAIDAAEYELPASATRDEIRFALKAAYATDMRDLLAQARKEALEEAATEIERVGPKGQLILITMGFADNVRSLAELGG